MSQQPPQRSSSRLWVDAFSTKKTAAGVYDVWKSERTMQQTVSLPNSQLTISGNFALDFEFHVPANAYITFKVAPVLMDSADNNQQTITRPADPPVYDVSAIQHIEEWPVKLPTQPVMQSPFFGTALLGSVLGQMFTGSPYCAVATQMRNFNSFATLSLILTPNCAELDIYQVDGHTQLQANLPHSGFRPIFDPTVHPSLLMFNLTLALAQTPPAPVLVATNVLQVPPNFEQVYNLGDLLEADWSSQSRPLATNMQNIPYGMYFMSAAGIQATEFPNSPILSVDSNGFVSYPNLPSGNPEHWFNYGNYVPPSAEGTYSTSAVAQQSVSTIYTHRNWTLAHQHAYARSIFTIMQDASATAAAPILVPINNSSDSANCLVGKTSETIRLTIGNTILPFQQMPGIPWVSGYPTPPYMVTMGAPTRDPTSISDNIPFYDLPSVALSTFSSKSQAYKNIAMQLAGSAQIQFGALDFGKNCFTIPGTLEVFFNGCCSPFGSPDDNWGYPGDYHPSQGFITPMPSGLCVNPRIVATNRFAFMFQDIDLSGNYTSLVTWTYRLPLVEGSYNVQSLANMITEQMNKADASGDTAFYRDCDCYNQRYLFVASDYEDDNDVPWKKCTRPANLTGPALTNARGRAIHAFAPPGERLKLGANAPACVVTSQGYLAFQNFMTLSTPTLDTTNSGEYSNGPGVYTTLNSYQVGPNGPLQWGAVGQTVEGQPTTVDTTFLQDCISAFPYVAAEALYSYQPSISLQNLQITEPGAPPANPSFNWWGVPSTMPEVAPKDYEQTQISTQHAPYMGPVGEYLVDFYQGLQAQGLLGSMEQMLSAGNIINPFGKSQIPGQTGVILLSIGDGSEEENTLLTSLGFDPAAVSRIWDPTTTHIKPIEGMYYAPRTEEYKMSKAALCLSNESPWLYKAIPGWIVDALYPDLETLLSDSDLFPTYVKNLDMAEVSYLLAGSVHYVPNSVTTNCPMYRIPDKMARDDNLIDTLSGEQQFLAVENYDAVHDCYFMAANSVWPVYNPRFRLTGADAVGFNMYNQHSYLRLPLTEPCIGETLRRATALDAEQQQYLRGKGWGYDGGLANTTIWDNGELGLGPYALYGFPGTSGNLEPDSENVTAEVLQVIPGSYCLRATWDLAEEIEGPFVVPTATYDVGNSQGWTQLWGLPKAYIGEKLSVSRTIQQLESLMMIVPEFSPTPIGYRFDYNTADYQLYLQGVTDAQNFPYSAQEIFDQAAPGGWLHYDEATVTLADCYRFVGTNIPMAGRIHCDQIVTAPTNLTPMYPHRGIWGIPTAHELTNTITAEANAGLIDAWGTPSSVIGVVTNFSLSCPGYLGYPFAGSVAEPVVETDSGGAGSLLTPFPIPFGSTDDPSNPTQIVSVASALLIATDVVSSAPQITDGGILLLRITNLAMTPSVVAYVNGEPMIDLIPITIQRPSYGLNIINFQTACTWNTPEQAVSWVRYELLDIYKRPLSMINEVQYSLVFEPTAEPTAAEQAYQSGRPFEQVRRENAPQLSSEHPMAIAQQNDAVFANKRLRMMDPQLPSGPFMSTEPKTRAGLKLQPQ